MKNKLSKFVPALLVAGVIIITVPLMNRAKAEQQRPPAGAVVFSAQENWQSGYPTGFLIISVSQGQHAPQILPGMDLATAMETLLAQGFEIRDLPGLAFMAIRR